MKNLGYRWLLFIYSAVHFYLSGDTRPRQECYKAGRQRGHPPKTQTASKFTEAGRLATPTPAIRHQIEHAVPPIFV